MHPDLERLVALQGLDGELKRLREEMEALPRHVAALAARSAAAQAEQVRVEEALAAEEKLRRGLESDVKDRMLKSARLKRQMDVVTTAAQAGALEHEIGFTADEVRRMEDTELESMERTEGLEAELVRAREGFGSAETMLERERLRSADVIDADRARIVALEPQRSAVRAGTGEPALATYDRISRARGTGIAEGVDGKCSACQMMLRPQKWNELRDRSNDDLMMTCESCGRLLFWNPARDAPQRKPAEREESIAARIVRSL